MIRKSAVGFGAAILLSACASNAGGFHDYAKVVDVEPLTKTVRVSQPRQECWNERVTHQADGDNAAGMIIGGIIGGVVGNRFGGGNGKKAAIAAGTLLGAGIGQQMGDNRRGRSYTTSEERCQTIDDYYEEQRVTGYRVAYRYKGHTYYTRTRQHPGDRIRVRVSVDPAY